MLIKHLKCDKQISAFSERGYKTYKGFIVQRS